MLHREFRRIRKALGFGLVGWGYAIGYVGNGNSVKETIRRYEGGQRPIPEYIARLIKLFERHGVPDEWAVIPEAERVHEEAD